MGEVDVDVAPRVQAQRASAYLLAERVELVRREDAAATGLATSDALELSQLLEGIDADIGVGADRDRDRARPDALRRQEAVPEVRLRGRARADGRTRGREQIQLGA